MLYMNQHFAGNGKPRSTAGRDPPSRGLKAVGVPTQETPSPVGIPSRFNAAGAAVGPAETAQLHAVTGRGTVTARGRPQVLFPFGRHAAGPNGLDAYAQMGNETHFITNMAILR